jgi:hypothetical protein
VTVFLHEVIHGLGFTGLLFEDDFDPPTEVRNYNSPNSRVSVFDAALYENGTTPTPLSTWAINNANPGRVLQAMKSTKLIFKPQFGPDISMYACMR